MPSSPPPAGQALKHHLALILIAGAVFFTNLGGMRLMDRDEPRNAGCAAEMLERNDWVTPTFNQELRTHKPVLTYWFMMTAYRALGVSEFSARFWSAALALGTVLMTYHIGRRLFDARAGLWAGVVTASSLWFAIAGRIATPDSVLIFFATLPIFIYVLAVFPADAGARAAGVPLGFREAGVFFPRRWWVAAAMYAAMGLAILAKGPVGLVLPTAVLGMFLLIVRLPDVRGEDLAALPRWRRTLQAALRPFAPLHFLKTCWSMRPITAIVIALAIATPWYLAVHRATDGAFTRGFFLQHNLGRATQSMEGHGGLFFLYYPLVTCVAFFPWSVFLATLFVELTLRLRRDDPWRAGYLLAACWVGVYVGLFSLAQTQLPSYVTPMYPGLGLIAGAYFSHLMRGTQLSEDWAPKANYWVFIAAGLGYAIALPVVSHLYLPGSGWLGVFGAIPVLGGLAALKLYAKGTRVESCRVFGAAAVATTIAVLGVVLPSLDARHQRSQELLQAARAHTPAGVEASLSTYGALEPSWVFYWGRPLAELRPPKDQGAALKALAAVGSFVIMPEDRFAELKRELPAGVGVLARIPYYMRFHKPPLVLVGRALPASGADGSGAAGSPQRSATP